MQSKTSSFEAGTQPVKAPERVYAGSPSRLINRTLFKKNLSRYWPLWGLVSFVGGLFPLAMLVWLIRDGAGVRLDPLEITRDYYSVVTYAVPLISLVYAMLCAVAVWRYLYTARSVGMMHTLPITRRSLLATNFLSGLVMMAIPYAVTGLLCVLITGVYGGFDLTGVLTTVAAVAGISFFYFSVATAVAFITGSAVAQAVLYLIFHFLAVALEWLGNQFAQGFVVGLSSGTSFRITRYLSPTVGLMETLNADCSFQEVPVPGRDWTHQKLVGVRLDGFWLVGVYVLAGIVLLALAWLLYSRRRSESAGDVVAVGWMKPVFRYGTALCAALSAGQALYALFWESFQSTYSPYYAAAPMAVCTVVAGLLGYYIASMLLAKTARVFRNTWKGALGVCVVCVGLCIGLRTDLFGVEKRVPAASEIKSVTVEVSSDAYTLKAGADDELIAQTLKLHEAIVDSLGSLRDYGGTDVYDDTEWDERGSAYLCLTYQLSSGQLKRRYELPITKRLLEQEGSYAQLLDQLMSSTQMQEKLLELDADKWVLSGAYVYPYNSGETTDLNTAQAQQLRDALARDCAAGHWKRYAWLNGDDDSVGTYYALELNLEFSSKKDLEKENDSEGSVRITTLNVEVRTDMTETIQCMEALGIAPEDLISYSEYNRQMDQANEEAAYDEAYETTDAAFGVAGAGMTEG